MSEVICGIIGAGIGAVFFFGFQSIKDYRKESFEDKVREQIRKVLDEYGIEPQGKLKTHHVKDY